MYDQTKYFRQIQNVLDQLGSDAAKSKYAKAVHKCFDQNSGAPTSPQDIALEFGFDVPRLHDYRFALAKSNAQEFFCKDANVPGITQLAIRSVTPEKYEDTFGRKPFKRGARQYWFSLAEWCVLLNVPSSISPPTTILDLLDE